MKIGEKNIRACCQCPALVLVDDDIYDARCGFGAFGGEHIIPTPAPVYLLNYIFFTCPLLNMVYGGNTL